MIRKQLNLAITIIILAVLYSMPVFALEPIVLDLKEAISIALSNNPDLMAAKNNLEMSGYERNIALGNFFPKLNISQQVIDSDNPVFAFGTLLNHSVFSETDFNVKILNNPDSITDYLTSVQLQQPIYNRGMEILGWKGSKIKQVKASEELEN